jgi:hypothetical protein
MTKYRFQVCLDKGTKNERWEYVHPVGGPPYEYDSKVEAERMARICYGDNPSDVRTVTMVERDDDMSPGSRTVNEDGWGE